MIDLRFDRVSKRYLIPQEAADDGGRSPWTRKLRNLWRPTAEFWAVRDVSFEVKHGEALGIIGHNGAGKSTILKLLAGITTPTAGEITIKGHVAALIEVGSGFHPELTGRENVYLSGSILGMRRSEIRRKLESIIDFAEMHKFIDTPVKRYSSGMYVRLGFAIAAHLEPEILLLDEVLAVGDLAFQRKCLERVRELRHGGKTIVFISHDLNAVERICDRVLLLRHGMIISDGAPSEVIEQYKASVGSAEAAHPQNAQSVREWADGACPGDAMVRLKRVRVCGEDGEAAETIDIRRPVGVEVTYDVQHPGHPFVPFVHVFNEAGLLVFAVADVGREWGRRPKPAGRYVSTGWIPGNLLSEGRFLLDIGVSELIGAGAVYIHEHGVVGFRVVDSLSGDSARGDYTGPMVGAVRPLINWTTRVEGGGMRPRASRSAEVVR